jgi:CheY-like chemotaxis protein
MPRILIVDDDPILRTAIGLMLEGTNFEIEEAADGRSALRILRARPADLILCDVFMPEKDGLEVLREVPREFAGIKVVAMSGGGAFHGTVNLLPLAACLGAAGVLHKPFEQAELLKVIRQALHPLPI